ncbi:MAG: 7,8-didemethyl-8-hydroxy-5-deazariboflavin synthase CofG [Candidatus Helarchaeota archaeon]|nr:7,8-didemethyl-8-hydroxy-5-deazariboflavin synthase CofG [Candidatus Helarchaeota archaeon]
MLSIEKKELLFKILKGKDINKEEALTIYSLSNSELLYFMYLSTNFVFNQFKGIVSFSKNIFIPLTNLCRNNCSYCGFRRSLNDDSSYILEKEKVIEIVKKGFKYNCKEALFTFGEKPEIKYDKIRKLLKKWGYSSIIEYLRDLCKEVIKIGLLPHSNPGILEKEELEILKDVNASLGLMLENSSDKLCGKGGPHEFSPGKVPELRIRTIELAGKLKIPFTTGILVGIGETEEERIESLLTIKKIHEKYGHIQEIIIQNFIPQKNTPMESHPPPDFSTMLKTIIIARFIFKDKINLQAPPNLNPKNLSDLLLSGINDWGGISPVTHDYINPDMSWPKISELQRITENYYFKLKQRLPIYPAFINDKFLPKFLKDKILSVVDEEGYLKE